MSVTYVPVIELDSWDIELQAETKMYSAVFSFIRCGKVLQLNFMDFDELFVF